MAVMRHNSAACRLLLSRAVSCLYPRESVLQYKALSRFVSTAGFLIPWTCKKVIARGRLNRSSRVGLAADQSTSDAAAGPALYYEVAE